MITALKFTAARRIPWLRAVYHHAETVRATLADPSIAGDPNTRPGPGGAERLDAPDVLIGGSAALDLVPDTETSRRAHLARGYIREPEQLMPYEPASAEFLAEVFS